MSRFDRYMLSQLLVAFGFFALVMVGVFWMTQSASLFDRLIRGGQSVSVFFEFSALSLPTLIRTVAPIAVFVAAIYATYRLSRESELTVMIATGASPKRLARAVLAFGLIVAVLVSILTWFLRPMSIGQLEIREREVARDVTAQLLNQGRFLHPFSGVTFYVRTIDDDGTLRDVFLSDQRNREETVSFTARESYVVRSGNQINLVMVDGIAMRSDNVLNTQGTTRFSDFTYDITDFVVGDSERSRSIRAIPMAELFYSRDALIDEGFEAGELAVEFHERVSWPLLSIGIALLGYSTLMLGSFSRFGLGPQVFGAFILLVMTEAFRSSVLPMVEKSPDKWYVAYVPFVVSVLISWGFLTVAGRPLFRRRSAGTD